MRKLSDIKIILGGMGVNISTSSLANIVSRWGGIGTVSGTAAEIVLARNLQKGDPGGHFRSALENFPFPEMADKVVKDYFVEGGIPEGLPYKRVPFWDFNPPKELIDLTICANFALVHLAKRGHSGLVNINYLDKIRFPHPYSLLGAMLAGVDCVTVGAGIPFQIPEVLESLSSWRAVDYRISVNGGAGFKFLHFDPRDYFGTIPELKRPFFFLIVSSDLLAKFFLKKVGSEKVDGIVVEQPCAGGHNAPPRRGRDYGEEDKVDLAKMRALGKPFWLGGGQASPEALREVISLGGQGIQVGSAFALCEESGLPNEIKRKLRRLGYLGELKVRTDFDFSPTGFRFKVVEMAGTMSEDCILKSSKKRCLHRFLAQPSEDSEGRVSFACPAQDISKEKTGCLCAGLLATAGIGDHWQPMVFTLGEKLFFLPRLMCSECDTFTAEDVLNYLCGGL